MSHVWSCIDLWPSKNLVQYYMPVQFKKDFFVYKNNYMVESTPGSLISYYSEAYDGSISDRQIIERSDLLQKC